MNNNYKMVDISFIVQWMKKFNIVFTWFKENGNLMQQEKDTMIKTFVKDGTGRRVLALNRPAAGKTGTTNDLYDAWFVGYTPQYVTGTWVGFDEKKSLGSNETGGRAASPIWLGFMQKILHDKPVRIFEVPQGVVFSRIDPQTGQLPVSESINVTFECFKEGTVPAESSTKKGPASETDDFFKTGL